MLFTYLRPFSPADLFSQPTDVALCRIYSVGRWSQCWIGRYGRRIRCWHCWRCRCSCLCSAAQTLHWNGKDQSLLPAIRPSLLPLSQRGIFRSVEHCSTLAHIFTFVPWILDSCAYFRRGVGSLRTHCGLDLEHKGLRRFLLVCRYYCLFFYLSKKKKRKISVFTTKDIHHLKKCEGHSYP